MPVWVRGAESAEIVSPFPQKLVLTALGNSGATRPEGITGRDRLFRQRRRAPGGARRRGPRQDRLHRPSHDADPGRLGLWPVRRAAPPGADHRPPQGRDRRSSSARSAPTITATPIPACKSSPTARRRSRPAALTRPRRRAAPAHPRPRPAGRDALTLVSQKHDGAQSGNVIADVPGHAIPAPILLSAAISTAGTSAPARSTMVPASPSPPRRRSTSWTPAGPAGRSASSGSAPRSRAGFGGEGLCQRHGMRAQRLRRRNRFRRRPGLAVQHPGLTPTDPAARRGSQRPLAPLGITKNDKGDADGTDLGPTIAAGAPWIRSTRTAPAISTVTTRRTTRSTRSIPAQLRQNVAAWTAMLAILSGGIESQPKQPKRR